MSHITCLAFRSLLLGKQDRTTDKKTHCDLLNELAWSLIQWKLLLWVFSFSLNNLKTPVCALILVKTVFMLNNLETYFLGSWIAQQTTNTQTFGLFPWIGLVTESVEIFFVDICFQLWLSSLSFLLVIHLLFVHIH